MHRLPCLTGMHFYLLARYEHLGDTVLGLVITNLLIDMFPGLRVGPSTVRHCLLSLNDARFVITH